MITYRQFKEYNDHEGEEWCFYIPVSGNETTLIELEKLLMKHGYEDQYSMQLKDMLTEAEVDTLVRFGGQGYMNNHNKLEGLIDIKRLEKALDEEEDPLYKGGIKEFIKTIHSTEIHQSEIGSGGDQIGEDEIG